MVYTLMTFEIAVLQLVSYSHTVVVLLYIDLKHKQLLLWVPQKLSLAAISCAKISFYLRSILLELGFPCDGPTQIYNDNASLIIIVNVLSPTERAWHINIQ